MTTASGLAKEILNHRFAAWQEPDLFTTEVRTAFSRRAKEAS